MNLYELSLEVGKAEAIKIAINQLNMTESAARFIIAVESGEINGDIIVDKTNG